ncbi:MAG: FAD-dependent oxidoreductase [Candidatus Thorarchaeota archaeon]|nr:MAG: FAD-dependent oxidoreductase [Candidatus Thorarchaeota archaeon]
MKIAIVGYGPGGAAAATAARTFDPKADILLLTEEKIPAHKKPGSALALENPNTKELYIPDWSPEMLSSKRIEVRTGTSVVGGNLKEGTIEVVSSKGKTSMIGYDRLIIATGGTPNVPDIPGVDLPGVFTIQSMADTSVIGEEMSKKQSFLIVGAGFSALETAERLYKMGKDVHIIVRSRLMRTQLEESMSEELLSRIPRKIQLHLGHAPSRVLGSKKAEGVEVGGKEVGADAVLFMTGVRPNTNLAEKVGLKVGPLGGIPVNSRMETEIEGVFAVGDCVEMTDPLTNGPILLPIGSTAARAGKQAGVAAVGREKVYDDTALRLQYDRIFDTDIVCIGHSSTTARGLDVDTKVSYVEDSSESMKVALVTAKDDRLIGGQVLGARMGARVGYEITKRVEKGVKLKEQPLLESRHDQILALLERSLGPIR